MDMDLPKIQHHINETEIGVTIYCDDGSKSEFTFLKPTKIFDIAYYPAHSDIPDRHITLQLPELQELKRLLSLPEMQSIVE
jgi:hypothetical protein